MTLCECGCGQPVTYGKKVIKWHISKESNLKRSLALKGICRTIETKLKMSGKNNHNFGKHQTTEIKLKQSIAHKGKHHTVDAILKMSAAKKGRPGVGGHKGTDWHPSNEHKLKIAIANKGRIASIETILKRSGKNNSSWIDGRSFLPYCQKFNKTLKIAVKERDNHTCQNCNELNLKKLRIHHIHYDKENCYPDLITVCVNCNSRANFNRKYWEELFMNKLNDRELLFWTKFHQNP